ncbi:trihelix transcription factor GTL1-like isoform X1 [Ananas comosus]|uniref:Trihelix transcription factor GTL1-like isoform X1 n=1 Tax=Ananas comosus TaxID=4615 RepID=A0A6P5EPE6_ANACO|nr:trihelix transcription factor GTL1-like isoform X1 [Ananas comosus]
MQQQGGSPYGVPPPEMAPFPSPTAPGPGPRPHILGIPPAADQQMPEAASPISSRPPPPAAAGAPRSAGGGFEELVSGAGGGGFPDDEALAGASDEAERGGAGNRWPKQETLALIKIRSEMDAAFREATLKGPLWEEVSRKLGELGYRRSAKKCKEKFENVHKYYKRTKENRAGRQDGKSYRFFSQLEALGASSSSGSPAPTTIGFAAGAAAMAGPSAAQIQPAHISAAAPPPPIVTPVRAATELGHGGTIQGISGSTTPTTPAAAPVGGISFSTNSSSSESDDTLEDEETEETGGQPHEHGSKRKRKGGSGGGGGGGSRKMMAFFDGLMKQMVERQEALQQRFLETIEKQEQDRMIREEAWRRQEMARLTREQELMAQERAMAASRDAAVLSFIQKISGQTIQLPTVPATPISAAPAPAPAPAPMPQPQRQTRQSPPPPPPPQPVPPQPQTQPQREFRQKQQSTEIVLHQASTSSHELVPVPDPQELAPGGAGFETVSSSRWPKAEVHALINLRSGLDIKYQEAGPKGPLWEEISGEMKKLGYNRSSKRCKEKWENINKYFKKVKESNKKRPEDSKTCPYFHQLDALYRRKQQGIGGGGGSSSSGHRSGDQEAYSHSNPQGQGNVLSIMPPPPPPPPPPSSQPPPLEAEIKTDGGKKNGGSSDGNGGGSGGLQIQTSNGGLTPTLFEEGPTKKPEDIVKELMERRDAADDCDEADDSFNMDGQDDDEDDDEEEDDDDEEGSKMRYEIQFQRPSNVSGGGGGNSSTAAAAATNTTTTTTTTGSFLAMVQ